MTDFKTRRIYTYSHKTQSTSHLSLPELVRMERIRQQKEIKLQIVKYLFSGEGIFYFSQKNLILRLVKVLFLSVRGNWHGFSDTNQMILISNSLLLIIRCRR